MREKQDHIHTMSRRDYARLTHMMKKKSLTDTTITRSQVWIKAHKEKNGEPSTQAVGDKMKLIQECSLESQNTTNIADDEISLVFAGRVRGMSFGVGASVQSNGTVKQLQNMVHDLQQEMQEMKQLNQQQMQEMRSMFLQSTKQKIHQEESNSKNISRADIRANTKCKLLHWCVDGLVVAEGRIAFTDPNTKVHHVVLGGSCWKVWVDKILVENVDLIRPNDEMQFLDDAVGSTIAWVSRFIVLCD